jgi:tetratricopeptide (TPR) repeat protein
MSSLRYLFGVLAVTGVAACAAEDQRTDTIDPEEALGHRESYPAGVTAQLDSGSAAFRANDLEGALRHYTRAAQLGPDVAAAWFGVYMAEDALGHDVSAAEALRRAQEVVPGATLIHPTEADTTR